MKSVQKLAVSAGAVTAAAAAALFAVPAGAASASVGGRHGGGSEDVVFAQNDSTAGNEVIAYSRTASGGLTQAGAYATGGAGGVLDGSVVDHTASEGGVAYDPAAKMLYTVNAGSSTITVFTVHGDRLTRLQVIGSGSTFPVSIAVHGNLVYVLNARDGGSVAGFLRAGGRLIAMPSWHRALGLDTSQSPEFTSTPGQIAFTPDGSKLVVTTKNGGNTVDVYAMGPLGPSAQPAVTATPADVPFGLTFDRRGHLVVTEAGPNAVASFAIARGGKLTGLDTELTGQAATCWVTADGDTLYASNAGSGTVSAYRDNGSGKLTALGNTATDAGTVDATVSADGKFLYAETGGAGIIDAFRIGPSGSLTKTGAAAIPGGAGAEGIVAP
jgi:6-phosphogluconolactonase (cycloisomerase 2 family)